MGDVDERFVDKMMNQSYQGEETRFEEEFARRRSSLPTGQFIRGGESTNYGERNHREDYRGNNTSRNFADRDTDVRESQNRSARYGSQHGHDRRQSGNFEHNDQHFSPNRDNNGQDRFKQDFNRSGHIWDGNNRDQLGHNNRGGRFSQDGNGQGQQQRGSDQRPGHPGKQIGRGSWQRGGLNRGGKRDWTGKDYHVEDGFEAKQRREDRFGQSAEDGNKIQRDENMEKYQNSADPFLQRLMNISNESTLPPPSFPSDTSDFDRHSRKGNKRKNSIREGRRSDGTRDIYRKDGKLSRFETRGRSLTGREFGGPSLELTPELTSRKGHKTAYNSGHGDWVISLTQFEGFFQHNGEKPKVMTIVTRKIRNEVLKMSLNTDARDTVFNLKMGKHKKSTGSESDGVSGTLYEDETAVKEKERLASIDTHFRVKKEDSQMNLICGGQGENQWEYIREDLRYSETSLPQLGEDIHAFNIAQLNKKASDVIIKENGIAITQHDLLTLTGLRWLNDHIIEFYLQMVHKRSLRPELREEPFRFPTVYPMNTYFFTRLCQGGYEKVKNWTKNVDIFSYDLVVIPVHQQEIHWACIIVDFRVPGVFYYDSLQGEEADVIISRAFLSKVINYLYQEHKHKKEGEELDLKVFVKVVEGCPQQENGSDCGLFLCKIVEAQSRDVQVEFKQHDMLYFRQRMIWEIGNYTLKCP